MTNARRIAGPQAKNRAVLLDAAERLLLTEGYAAVTSRRVAAEAGLKPQLVHYYFATMDDLYLAVFRRRAEEGLARQATALASDEPLRALWNFSLDDAGTALTSEFVALANHRKEIRSEIARYAERFRTMQVAALADILESAGVDTTAFSPGAVSVFLTSLSRVVIMERTLGLTAGHDDAVTVAERFIEQLDR
jgi:TetR/AcrR family transcriptional regulator